MLPTARHVLFVGHQLSNNNTQVRRTSPSPDGTQARSCAEVVTFRNAHTSTPCGKSASVLATLLAPMRNFRGTISRADPERRCEGHNTVTLTKGRTGDHQPLGARPTQQHIVSADGSRTDMHVMTLYMILHVVETVLELYYFFEQQPLSHEGTRHHLRLSTLVSKSTVVYSVTEHKKSHTPVLRVLVKPPDSNVYWCRCVWSNTPCTWWALDGSGVQE